jgi:hypothetical protein
MTAAEIEQILESEAKYHLEKVRRHLELMIGQTKQGTVILRYNAATKIYQVIKSGQIEQGKIVDPLVLAEGKAAVAKKALKELYVVE